MFKLIAQSEPSTKFMYMQTIKEIINTNAKCLTNYLPQLLPLYLEQAHSDQASIVGIVSESIGKLYIVASDSMEQQLLKVLSSNDLASVITVAKSFKYSAFKNENQASFIHVVPHLYKLMQSPNLDIKLAALEALSVLASNRALNELLGKNLD